MSKFSLQYNETEINPITIGSDKKVLSKNVDLISLEETDLQNTEGALLNILDDYSKEKNNMAMATFCSHCFIFIKRCTSQGPGNIGKCCTA